MALASHSARAARLPALSNHVRVPSPEDVRVPRAESNGHPGADGIEEGVLSNLPRTRPQRATERRIASREGKRRSAGTAKATGPAAKGATTRPAKDATDGPAKGTPRSTAAKSSGAAAGEAPKRATRAASPRKPRKSAKPRAQAARENVRPKAASSSKPADSAPRQGFESEPSRSSTGPVQPPGGTELLTGAVEIVGEMAKAGVSAGERVLRDLFSRLPH